MKCTKVMDPVTMAQASFFAKQCVEAAIDKARQMECDSRKIERLHACKCIACFYRDGRQGCAVTRSQPCMCCGAIRIYPSTATDALCLDCAMAHKLCKECGGDIDMRANRRKWPQPIAPKG